MHRSTRIQDLKRDFGAEQDLIQLMERFYDCVQADPTLVTAAQVSRSRDLRALVGQVASAMLGQPVRAGQGRLWRVPRHRMIHGPCWVAGLPATVVWFEDLRQGLMLIVMGTGETRCSRFTQVGGVDSPDLRLN